jgi:hypothetical protein
MVLATSGFRILGRERVALGLVVPGMCLPKASQASRIVEGIIYLC